MFGDGGLGGLNTGLGGINRGNLSGKQGSKVVLKPPPKQEVGSIKTVLEPDRIKTGNIPNILNIDLGTIRAQIENYIRRIPVIVPTVVPTQVVRPPVRRPPVTTWPPPLCC